LLLGLHLHLHQAMHPTNHPQGLNLCRFLLLLPRCPPRLLNRKWQWFPHLLFQHYFHRHPLR